MVKTLAFISSFALSKTVVIAAQSPVTNIVGQLLGLVTDSKDKIVANGKAEQLVDEKYPDKFLSLSTFDDLLHGKCDAQEQSNDAVLSPNTNLNAVEMSHSSRTRNILDEVFEKETGHNGELVAVQRSLDSKNGTLLSFGANDGTELLELLRRFPNSQAWGYEIDNKTVKQNQQALKSKGVYEFTSKFEDLPEHGFDFIACNFVMFCNMSLSQFEGFMKTFGRLLKKDGMLELVVYDKGSTPKSGFDARLIRKYTDKYPTQPMVYRSIAHPGGVSASSPATAAGGHREDTSIQQMRKMAHMKLFMLWPNRGAEEVPKSALETTKKHPRGAQGSVFLMPEGRTSIPEGM